MNPLDRSERSHQDKQSLERTFAAPIETVWALWTTKEGIESWWGPDGFEVSVHSIDLRPGGTMEYAMAATAPEQISFMQRAGMPVVTDVKITYTKVEPLSRLAYLNVIDFVPNVGPYTAAIQVDLIQLSDGVKMVVTLDPMHDHVWTDRAVKGWESQLSKLSTAIARSSEERL